MDMQVSYLTYLFIKLVTSVFNINYYSSLLYLIKKTCEITNVYFYGLCIGTCVLFYREST